MSASYRTNEDILRAELQTAIAAARELGPEMDRHLADSVLDRYRSEVVAREAERRSQAVSARPNPLGAVVARRGGSGEMNYTVIAVAGLLAFVAVMIANPEFWWIVFLLPCLCGGWGWRRRSSWSAR